MQRCRQTSDFSGMRLSITGWAAESNSSKTSQGQGSGSGGGGGSGSAESCTHGTGACGSETIWPLMDIRPARIASRQCSIGALEACFVA